LDLAIESHLIERPETQIDGCSIPEMIIMSQGAERERLC